ncbi:ABC transporter ATP-binding protein [Candidatus Saccharibacteria bacterium]|nr:ABC transporter ATP-binding protein [Candidatus Saccharibacteria bacterium]
MKRSIGTRTEITDLNAPAITVKNLHKSFRLPTEQAFGLKQAFFNRLRGIKGYKEQKVLKGLDFEIKQGEFLGIVGRNGSGKSTLLKILAGIYYPEKGEVTINGNLIPFIELGVGFNPELTGRENVYLNGALLGFSNTEMDAMYNDIWKFAELEPFQDQKLKNYSSGMQVRLAFSIAIRARGDILLLDEVLAVGDAAFQQKCTNYFESLKENHQTVVLVTHSMENVRKFCTRAILLDDGKIVKDGDSNKIADAYLKLWS